MNLKKYLSLATILGCTILSISCYNQPSNVLDFTPNPPTSQFNATNQLAIINVIVNDLRKQPEISSYTKNATLLKLTSNPNITKLFDQIVKQDLNAKGFRITNLPEQANTNIIVNIHDFYAKVGQGNLRYNIKSNIQLEIKVQTTKGEFTKKFGGIRSQEGAFGASNNEIHKVLSQNLSDVTQSIYQDQDITKAINKYLN